jgi:hypothetical protein
MKIKENAQEEDEHQDGKMSHGKKGKIRRN